MQLHVKPGEAATQKEYEQFLERMAAPLAEVDQAAYENTMLGWLDYPDEAHQEMYRSIELLSQEIRQEAEVLVVVGLGGSNQGARAVIEALDCCRQGKRIEILYAGVNLSAAYYNQLVERIGGRSVYLNVIAKNFKTLEPGVAFRLLRSYMHSRYTPQEAARRIITTATIGDGELHKLSQEQGYRYLPFPQDVGGRYSVFTAVGLLPIAVAGLDWKELLQGAGEAQRQYRQGGPLKEAARTYAAWRTLLLEKNYDIEVLAFFEPSLEALGRWWRQLFGESEGKNHTGIFPAVCSYSEDLHSMGQYLQQGKRQMSETFIKLATPPQDLPIPTSLFQDNFEYLEGRTLNWINQSACEATIVAHSEGGVPCMILELESLNAYEVGALLFFFMTACFYSARMLQLDPFDQPGVENYKDEMFKRLKP